MPLNSYLNSILYAFFVLTIEKRVCLIRLRVAAIWRLPVSKNEQIRSAETLEPWRGLQGARCAERIEGRAHRVGAGRRARRASDGDPSVERAMVRRRFKERTDRSAAGALLDGAADILERGGRRPVAEVDAHICFIRAVPGDVRRKFG